MAFADSNALARDSKGDTFAEPKLDNGSLFTNLLGPKLLQDLQQALCNVFSVG